MDQDIVRAFDASRSALWEVAKNFKPVDDNVDNWRQLIAILCQELGRHVRGLDAPFVLVQGDSYDGDLLFLMGVSASHRWVSYVHYGTCNGCDAMRDALTYGDAERPGALFQLMLHVAQHMARVENPFIEGSAVPRGNAPTDHPSY